MPAQVSKEFRIWVLTVDVALLDNVYHFCQVIEARGGGNRHGANMARWEAFGVKVRVGAGCLPSCRGSIDNCDFFTFFLFWAAEFPARAPWVHT